MLIPFFFPRGFLEYFSAFKYVYLSLLILSLAYILLTFSYSSLKNGIKLGASVTAIVVYHIILLLITLGIQGEIAEGIQKIFLAPALCILCFNEIKKNSRRFISVLANILIIDFVLNFFVFNQWLFPQYFLVDNHILFMGHVQVVAQIGLIALLLGYLLKYDYEEKKGTVLMVLAFINMIYSDTLVSYVSLFLFTIGVFAINKSRLGQIANKPFKFFVIMILASLAIVGMTIYLDGHYFLNGMDVSISGRMFIWKDAIEKLNGHWLFGYGVYGVLLQVFWNAWAGNASGSNYAHNEILQLLLDGGIVLFVIYLLMIVFCIKEMEKAKNAKDKKVAVLLFAIFMAISLVESITEYYYFFAFICMISNFDLIQKKYW